MTTISTGATATTPSRTGRTTTPAREGLGSNDETILQVDADGVTLAAIPALDEKVERLHRESVDLRRELRALRSGLRIEARPSR